MILQLIHALAEPLWSVRLFVACERQLRTITKPYAFALHCYPIIVYSANVRLIPVLGIQLDMRFNACHKWQSD